MFCVEDQYVIHVTLNLKDPIKKEMLGKLLTELQNITRIKDQAKNGEDHALK